MLKRLRERNELKFFAVLRRADRRLAFVWWLVLLLRGVLPAVFAIAMGALVAAVQRLSPVARVRPAPRDGPPRRSETDRGSDGGARLRPWHDRAAVVLRAGFHCRLDGGNGRRSRSGPGALCLRLVGAAHARRRLARH